MKRAVRPNPAYDTISAPIYRARPDLDLWDREYREIQSIPSSTRAIPSKALVLFDKLIEFGRIQRAFDAGCGNGRNAVYLAKKGCKVVTADSSKVALDSTKKAALQSGVKDRIATVHMDLMKPFPFSSEFDLVLDSYVSCHFTENSQVTRYWTELARVTRVGGLVFSSVFSPDDEYYHSIPRSSRSNSRLVTDPTNGITKRLYEESEFKAVFPTSLLITYFVKFQFWDNVLGNNYLRSLYVALLTKGKFR